MKYDLGQKYDNSPCCSPASDTKEPKISYPSLYFTHDEAIDIPEEGEAVIKFRRIESSENTRDPEDPKYRCELEVQSIDVKGGTKDKGLTSSVGDALKTAMRKSMKRGGYAEE